MELNDQFADAQVRVKTLKKRPSNDQLLQLYSLFKQASQGDASGKRPGRLDPINRAKFDAWAKLAGTSGDDAKTKYVALVDGLLG